MSNWNRKHLESQFNRVVKNGWLKHFEDAARTITKGYFDTADLIAIGSRESNLDPKWLTKAGDRGNGFGLMQADKRSFPEFTKGDGWRDARTGILFGAKVLMQKWADYENNIGKNLTVKSSKGGVYRYKAQKAEGIDEQRLVLSSYNCGRWSQYCLATGQDLDKYSTGKDYGADVMKRAAIFRQLLKSKVSPSDPESDFTPQTAPLTRTATESLVDEPQASETNDIPEVVSSDNAAGKAVETSATRETSASGEETVSVTAEKVNEQDVNKVEVVKEPAPYNEIGFFATIKRDLTWVLGGNVTAQTVTEYGQQAQTVVPASLLTKLAYLIAAASVCYLLFRVVHYLIDTYKKNQRVRLEAEINTDITRKNMKYVTGDWVKDSDEAKPTPQELEKWKAAYEKQVSAGDIGAN